MDDPRRSLDLPMLALGALVLYYIARTVYRLFFHPLARVPGPRIAAISSLYEFYWDCVKFGRYHVKIDEMHEKYGKTRSIVTENLADVAGPIVRINPWEVHIDDPAFVSTLYNNSKLEKDPFCRKTKNLLIFAVLTSCSGSLWCLRYQQLKFLHRGRAHLPYAKGTHKPFLLHSQCAQVAVSDPRPCTSAM